LNALLVQLMSKLATSLQHQVRYDYNRSTEVRPTMPSHLVPTPAPSVPSASYIQHITHAWDTMHTQVRSRRQSQQPPQQQGRRQV